jgi:phage shock protein PspC (stress-responsive transcriptional regulator)
MNKVVTVSISGIVFTIDENAYLVLRSYLDRLKIHFAGTEGRDEILSDIESRIAEMLQERLHGRGVVEESDINDVIAIMGKPEDLAEGEPAQEGAQNANTTGETRSNYQRRVFRDPDSNVIGGVCAGIANYFGFDPLFLRLAFVVAFFGFGTGLLLYIILWIIIPEAKTASEKLQMKGERINVSNIEKTVKEKIDGFGEDVKEFGRTNGDRFSNFIHQLVDGLKPVGEVILKIVAVGLVVISVCFVVALVGGALGIVGLVPASYPAFINDIFDSGDQMTLAMLGMALALGVPFLAMLYFSLRVLLNIRKRNTRWVGGTFLALWIAGVAILVALGIQVGNNFKSEETVTESTPLNLSKRDTIYLNANNIPPQWYKHKSSRWHRNGMVRVNMNNDEDPFRVWLDIRPSKNKEFTLVKEMTARGSTRQDAYARAVNIVYNFRQSDNELILDDAFTYNKESKWRAQELRLILEVPVGKVVVLRRGMESIIYDIKNEQDMLDDDMIGYHWQMTDRWLTCLDCPHKTSKDWNNEDEDDGESFREQARRHVNLVIL